MSHLFDLRGESREKVNDGTPYNISHTKFCLVSKYGSGDEIQIKDDV